MRDAITIRLTSRAIFLVLAALAFVWVVREATHIVVVLFVAVVLAAAVSSVANWGEAHRIGRGLAIGGVYLAIVALLAGVVALIVPVVSGEVSELRRNLPAYEQRVNALLARIPREGEPVRADELVRNLAGRLGEATAQAGRIAATAGTTLLTLLLILVVAYFLAADTLIAEKIVGRFVPPPSRPRALRLLAHVGDQLGDWMRAQLILALIFGVAFGLGLWAIGVPFALTLGTVGVVLELIPYVGGLSAALLATLLAATTGDLWRVAATVLLYLIVANIEANLITPRIMGNFVGLPPVIVLVSVFVGVQLVGGIGALLAVPVAIIIKTLLDEFWTFPEDAPGPGGRAGAPATDAGGRALS